MRARPTELDVFLNGRLVGTAFDTEPLSFEYSKDWVADGQAVGVGKIPRRPGRHDGGEVIAFFDNLLPEGDMRAHLSRKHHASTVFSLLLVLGADSIGAFVLLPRGEKPSEPRYEPTSWDEIGRELRKGKSLAADIRLKDARISLSGAQDKTSIALDANGRPMLPHGYSPSTHILKPDIERIRGVYASAANETIIMRTARHAGLDVADVFYEPISRSCVIARFDRAGRPPDEVSRIVQYDLCQLSGTRPAAKYEAEGGPGVAQCAAIIRAESSQPAVDLRRLLDWMFFNVYAGNNDGHAKNLSIFYPADTGAVLTPFYDLVCTRAYRALSAKSALAVGGQWNPGRIERKHVEEMARQVGVRPEYAIERGASLADNLPNALERALEEVMPDLDEGGRNMAANVRKLVTATARSISARMLKSSQ